MSIYENDNILMRMKTEIPNFDDEELLEYTKIIIQNLHSFFCNGKLEKLNRYCSDALINKVLQNKEKYRITKNMDNVRVGYARLYGYVNKENKYYIKVYSSVFFYDDVDNNYENEDNYDKYWNDIWVVTYEGIGAKDNLNKCPTCGASMEYNLSKHMFTCNYCRNSLYYSQINWKLVDIDVNGINYT